MSETEPKFSPWSQIESEIESANGATVAYNDDVKVTYRSDRTNITKNGNPTPDVYNTITNPLDRSWALDNITIYFDGIKGGEVTGFEIYYGNVLIYLTKTSDAHVTTWSQNIFPFKIADFKGYGILVTLHLNLPAPDSGISLYTVDLTFVNNNIKKRFP